MVAKEWKSQILVNYPVLTVPRCIVSNAKTLGLKHLQFPGLGASGEPPDGARVIHYQKDELLIQQDPFLMERSFLSFWKRPNTSSI